MGHLTDEDRALRRDLLDHLEHIKSVGLKPREALEQLVREIAFTHLNRLCAYKMMEARGLIRETVSRGLKSQGFFFYLADRSAGTQHLHQGHLEWNGCGSRFDARQYALREHELVRLDGATSARAPTAPAPENDGAD